MSAAESIPTSPAPGKDPPNLNPPTTSPSSSFKPHSPSSLSMPPPPLPTLQTTSTSISHLTGESTLKPRPPFTPFFTLVNDLSSGTQNTFHPKIHYLFSDDDDSLLTDTLLQTLSANQNVASASIQQPSETGSSSSSAMLPPQSKDKGRGKPKEAMRRREERVVIVDINEDGSGVKAISSLNPTWQVLNAGVENAPTWEGDLGDDENGLMLRIEGVSVERYEEAEKQKGSGVLGDEEVNALVDGFEKRMAVLRGVVGAVGEADAGPDEGECGKREKEEV